MTEGRQPGGRREEGGGRREGGGGRRELKDDSWSLIVNWDLAGSIKTE